MLGDGRTSNRQLQIALAVATAWCAWQALRTRTVALSSVLTGMAILLHLALLTDVGLRLWLEEGRWDLLGAHLAPLLVLLAALGRMAERRQRGWLARPVDYAAAGLLVIVLELLALDGRAMAHLGLTLAPFQPADVSDPLLLDTVAILTLNGVVLYLVGVLLEGLGSIGLKGPARMLLALAPFAVLEPLLVLCRTGEYSLRLDWLYLVAALAVAFLSHLRQRRSFYYAGIINTGIALLLITDHNEWLDRPAWAIAVLLAAAVALGLGALLESSERRGGPSS
jgi:hypothetical protein